MGSFLILCCSGHMPWKTTPPPSSKDGLLTSLQEQGTLCSQEGTAQERGSPQAHEPVPRAGRVCCPDKGPADVTPIQESLMRDPDGSVYI